MNKIFQLIKLKQRDKLTHLKDLSRQNYYKHLALLIASEGDHGHSLVYFSKK